MSNRDKIQLHEDEVIRSGVKTINDFSLFAPKSERDIRNDYPELREVEEFKKLSKSDMLFIWYYACEASPLAATKSDQKRAQVSIDYIRRINPNLITGKFEKYAILEFDYQMEAAINRMMKYRMGIRVRAKKMIDSILSNYEKIACVDINGAEFLDKEGSKDFTKIKAYVDSSKTMSTNLPGLIEQAERGFSVTEDEYQGSEDMGDGDTLMDDYIGNLED